MKLLRSLIENPALCSLVVAVIGLCSALLVAFIGWLCSCHVVNRTIRAERHRLIAFHKLEIYENAIEEINYLVPLYRELWHVAYEKRSPSDIQAALPELRSISNLILDYQKKHNALGKVKVYSKALDEYVPFSVNPVCLKYIQDLDAFEKFAKAHSTKDLSKYKDIPHDMYLIDELQTYEKCASLLKEEIESLDFFER
jgi:CRISPR/Cas system-associated endonuclease/helicase Cas3